MYWNYDDVKFQRNNLLSKLDIWMLKMMKRLNTGCQGKQIKLGQKRGIGFVNWNLICMHEMPYRDDLEHSIKTCWLVDLI